MRRLNKIIFLFLSFIGIMVFIIWQLIQTQKFADIVSGQITKELTSRVGLDVKFSKLRIGLIPPSTIIENLYLTKKSKGKKELELKVGLLEAVYGWIDILSNKISIKKIYLKDGFLNLSENAFNLNKKKKRKKEKKILISDLFFEYRKFLDEIPIRPKNINLEFLDVFIGNERFSILTSEIKIFKEILELDAKIEEVGLKKIFPDYKFLGQDWIDFSIQLSRNKLRIKKLKSQKEFEKIVAKINLTEINEKLFLSGNLNAYGRIKTFLKIKELDFLKLRSGILNLNVNFEESLKQPKITYNGKINDLKFEYGTVDDLKFSGIVEKDRVHLRKLNLTRDKGQIRILKGGEIFNLKNQKYLTIPLKFKISNYKSKEALYFLRDTFSDLDTMINGNFTFQKRNATLILNFKEDFELSKVKIGPDKKVHLFDIEKVGLDNTRLEVNSDTGKTLVNAKLTIGSAQAEVKGEVAEKNISLEMNSPNLDLSSVGPISGVFFDGVGNYKIRVSGPPDNVLFKISQKTKNFKFLDIEFGTVEGRLDLGLKDLLLKIGPIKGQFKESNYSLEGQFDIKKNNLKFRYDFPFTNYKNFLAIFGGVINKNNTFPQKIKHQFKFNGFLEGKATGAGLKLYGSANGSRLTYQNFSFDSLSFDYKLENLKLDITKINFKKNKGNILGKFETDLNNNYVEYDFSLENVYLNDINYLKNSSFGYKGRLKGELYGSGIASHFSSRVKLEILDGTIGKRPVKNTSFVLYRTDKNWTFEGKILEDLFYFKSSILFENKKESTLEGGFNIRDPRLIGAIISGEDNRKINLRGKILGTFNSKFNLRNLLKSDFDLKFNSFEMNKRGVNLKLVKNKDSISVRDGNVVKWDIFVEDTDSNLISFGKGNFLDSLKVENNFKLKSTLFEGFFPSLVESNGNIIGSGFWKLDKKKFSSRYDFSSSDLTLNLSGIPGKIENINLKSIITDQELLLQEFQGSYGNGLVKVDGTVIFKFPYPKINLGIGVERANIPFFRKSSIILDGKASLKGDKFPYSLIGEFSIPNGEVLDEFDQFRRDKKSEKDYRVYLPKRSKNKELNLLDIHLKFGLTNPLVFKNTVADLKFEGGLDLLGSITDPNIKGEIGIVEGESKFFFKGNEFKLSKGNINFEEYNKDDGPILDFSGSSKIKEYLVTTSFSGKTNNISINFKSEPPLPQEEILSLLAIGITSKDARKLGDKDVTSITSVGVGTLLADQLKLNEELTSNLGLKLSVAPELEEDDSSVTSGQGGGISSVKFKSATKIKLKKKILDNLELSISSTVGGNLEKQEMTLDYIINKNVSIEGILEQKSATVDSDANESETGGGVDLKFKWSFK